MEKESNKFLKVTGILMIIGGAFGIIVGIIAVLGVGVLALALGAEANMGLLMAGSVLVLISAVVSLIAGIIGVKNAAVPEKAKTCIIFGIMTAVFAVLGSTLSVIGGQKFNVASLIIGLGLPALYLIGAFQNKNLGDTKESESIVQ
ncbi:MAG: hypothetical protein GX752_02550 [Clostridium sp.]|nr:hypothetical protein [Clostridium sp.]